MKFRYEHKVRMIGLVDVTAYSRPRKASGSYQLVSSPDRFFPFLFVVAETTNKNGKKRSGDETSYQ